MVSPGFLENPEVVRWLGGIEPAWTLLTLESLNALRRDPSDENRTITLADDLTDLEIAASAVVRNALVLIERAGEGAGLKLTATGNLSRAAVADMIERFDWPNFDREMRFSLRKVINEPDFPPLSFIRSVAAAAKLVRPYRGALVPTRLGRELSVQPRRRALQAILFHAAFWRIDLTALAPFEPASWPQPAFGPLLWSLSVSAGDWQSQEKLTRLCAVPVSLVLESTWDRSSALTGKRILQPLHWFGLMERRSERIPGKSFEERHFYRKAPLFDRMLGFNVELERPAAPRH